MHQPYPQSTAFSDSNFSHEQQATIREAIDILQTNLRTNEMFTAPQAVKQFCRLQLANKPDEQFCCMFLDARHRLIAFENLFSGTIDSASVYPRVVVRRSLELNAAAVIFTHNHPSGDPEPSEADRNLTGKLKDALALIDVRTLDHIVVGTEGTVSMAERGQI